MCVITFKMTPLLSRLDLYFRSYGSLKMAGNAHCCDFRPFLEGRNFWTEGPIALKFEIFPFPKVLIKHTKFHQNPSRRCVKFDFFWVIWHGITHSQCIRTPPTPEDKLEMVNFNQFWWDMLLFARVARAGVIFLICQGRVRKMVSECNKFFLNFPTFFSNFLNFLIFFLNLPNFLSCFLILSPQSWQRVFSNLSGAPTVKTSGQKY